MAKKSRKEPIVPESMLEIDGFVGDMIRHYNSGKGTYLVAVLMTCCGMCFVPFCVNRCKDEVEQCSNCHVV